jgi:acetylornithine deacetylase/succinyl-diaminopimelate desuccinylase-like protein
VCGSDILPAKDIEDVEPIVTLSRRDFVSGTLVTGATLLAASHARGAADRNPVYKEIEKQHDESVARLQQWLRQGAIAAENKGMQEGCDMMRRLALDAGFQHAECIQTKGHPGMFATLDAGARKTLALYFMYDVKQADPSEWTSPPWEARLLDMPKFGKVVMARGAVNQKGPQAAFLAALHAMRAAGRKIPVNLVLVAEGEEEIGSPNFPEIVFAPQVKAALQKTIGVFMPSAEQELDGSVTITLGSKGDVECELIATSQKWGRGSTQDIHSSAAARIDQPAWRLVQALNTLVTPNGDPAIDGFTENVRQLIVAQRAVYRSSGIDPMLWPRSGGSWPGSVFTGEPLKLAAGHFGLGYGERAHAPDEFYVIESAIPAVSGMQGATRSFVDYLYALA